MEKCKICGQEKEMYFVPWCPKCEKPEVINVPQLNFVKCLHYLEANGHFGIRDRVWDYFADCIHNDSSFKMPLPPEVNPEDYSEQVYQDTLLIKETFGIKDEQIEMYVSW